MSKRKINKYLLPAATVICVIVAVILWSFRDAGSAGDREAVMPPAGMFEWNEDTIGHVDDALRLIDALPITRWYQEVDENLDADAIRSFIRTLGRQGVRVYALIGSVEWGFEADARSLIGQLKTIVQYNENVRADERFYGIMLDIEPYTTQRWKAAPEESMETYVNSMRSAYRFLYGTDLRTALCIPRHYDDQELMDGLEALIRDCCDEVAVMDYDCGNEVEKIRNEKSLAQKYGKELHCILEFQEVGKHGLTEDKTYGNKGLEAADAVWNTMQEMYADTVIVRDYHWAQPVAGMLEEVENAD